MGLVARVVGSNPSWSIVKALKVGKAKEDHLITIHFPRKRPRALLVISAKLQLENSAQFLPSNQ